MIKGLLLLAAAGFAASAYSKNRRKRLGYEGRGSSFSTGRSGSYGYGSNPGTGSSAKSSSGMSGDMNLPGQDSPSKARSDDLLSPGSSGSSGVGTGSSGASGI